jgi:hypothetical protein
MTTIKIKTRYIGPSATFAGAKIRATGAGRQATVAYDHGAVNLEARHALAAQALANKLTGETGGTLALVTDNGDNTMVFHLDM